MKIQYKNKNYTLDVEKAIEFEILKEAAPPIATGQLYHRKNGGGSQPIFVLLAYYSSYGEKPKWGLGNLHGQPFDFHSDVRPQERMEKDLEEGYEYVGEINTLVKDYLAKVAKEKNLR